MAEFFGDIISQRVNTEVNHETLQQALDKGSDDSIMILTNQDDIPSAMIDQLLLELNQADEDWDMCYLDFKRPKGLPIPSKQQPFSIFVKDKELINLKSAPLIISPQGRRKLLSAINQHKTIQHRIDSCKIYLLVKG